MVFSCAVIPFVFFLNCITHHWTMDSVHIFQGVHYIRIKFIRDNYGQFFDLIHDVLVPVGPTWRISGAAAQPIKHITCGTLDSRR